MIAIVAPLSIELQGLRRFLKLAERGALGDTRFYAGTINDREVVLAHTGVGGERAQSGIRDVIDRFSPESIVIVGYCGATHTRMKTGDILICHRIMQYDGDVPGLSDAKTNAECYCDHEMVVRAVRALEHVKLNFHRSGCLTVNKVCATRIEKEWVGSTFPVLGVDLENAFYAGIAKELNVPLLAIRITLDEVEYDLPDVGFAFDASGQLSRSQILKRSLAHPFSILRLLRTRSATRLAGRRITEFIPALLEEL